MEQSNGPVWSPQPRQAIFMSRPEYEALYGGAAGGGKSDALLMEALRQVHIPHYRGLILRKTFPQLTELIDRSREVYGRAFPSARYNDSKHCWTFPSGAKIYFGSMQYTKDRINYQGKRFDYIAFDELTHFTWDEYSYMFSRNRPGGPGTRCYIRAATNPGGIGHGWVKQRFIDPAPPMMTIRRPGEKPRIFVPARVYDNHILLNNDPTYLDSEQMLPEAERKALLEGSWDSFSGQVFTEFTDDPEHYYDRRWTHVIDPFDVPAHWRIYRGFDWGYAKPFAVTWTAADEKGRLYMIKELYGWNGNVDTGCMMEPLAVAAKIKEIETQDPLLRGKVINGVADPAIFQKTTGQSIAEIMEKERVYFTSGDNSRLSGKMQYHYRLRFNEDGIPMMYVFSNCVQFIRTFRELTYDEKHVEDVNTKGEDHLYDAQRYVLMENPITAPLPAKPKPFRPDPLDLGLNRR
ncbi:MAG TPA: terminase family protein [Syntrophales bacterium]|nr:terminase family protein [Syntrophales bacterium]